MYIYILYTLFHTYYMCIYDKPEAGFYSNRGLSLTNTQLPLQSVSPSRRSQLKGP